MVSDRDIIEYDTIIERITTMGKIFIILGIIEGTNNNEFRHLCIKDMNNSNDIRFLHVEPKGISGILVGGVEMSSDFSTIYEGTGYVLKEANSKPLNQWCVGDLVSEQFYPVELDGRVQE